MQPAFLDRGQLAAEIGSSVGKAVCAGLETFERNFLNKVALETRSEHSRYLPLRSSGDFIFFSRATDQIMSELCQLKGIKDVSEMTHETVNNLEVAFSDIAKAIGASRAQVSSLVSKVGGGGLTGTSQDILSQIRTTLSANSALLSEALKVNVVLDSWLYYVYT